MWEKVKSDVGKCVCGKKNPFLFQIYIYTEVVVYI